MAIYHDLYGLTFDITDRLQALRQVANRLEKELGVTMALGGSDWTGPDFSNITGDIEGERITVYLNYVDFEEAWNQPQHKEFPLLLVIKNSPRGSEIEMQLNKVFQDNIKLLSRNSTDDKLDDDRRFRAQMIRQYVQEIWQLEKDGADKELIEKRKKELEDFKKSYKATKSDETSDNREDKD